MAQENFSSPLCLLLTSPSTRTVLSRWGCNTISLYNQQIANVLRLFVARGKFCIMHIVALCYYICTAFYCIRIRTRGGIYGKIYPFAWRSSQGRRGTFDCISWVESYYGQYIIQTINMVMKYCEIYPLLGGNIERVKPQYSIFYNDILHCNTLHWTEI